jgi:hypothetical protein
MKSSEERNEITTYLLHKGPEISELLQDGLVSDGTDIFDMVKGLPLLVTWDTTNRFTGINTLQNTEPPEVFQVNL